MNEHSHDPLVLLAQMEAEYRSAAPGLPQQVEAPSVWSGLGFRVGDWRLVTLFGQIAEVVPTPDLTPIPLTRPWLRGIANVRGELLAIVDLALFFELPAVPPGPQSRLLVVNQPGLHSALLVSEVYGLKHFLHEQEMRQAPALEGPIARYLTGGFVQDNETWAWLDVDALSQSEAFLHAAA